MKHSGNIAEVMTRAKPSLPPSPAVALVMARRWVPVGYAAIILAGALLLRLPGMTERGLTLTGFDSLFLAVSAVCGVGLSTIEPDRVLSPMGWVVMTLLIEAGLLVFLVLGALVVHVINERFQLEPPTADPPPLLPSDAFDMRDLVRRVTMATLGLQAVGAAVMVPLWREGTGGGERIALSVFHAVAAVGHCGFSPLPDGLQPYRYAPLVHAVILPLIVLGGLGYPVLREVCRAMGTRGSVRVSPYARLVLTTTLGLYLAGTLTLTAATLAPYYYESLKLGVSANMPVTGPLTLGGAGRALADASFLSVSARSAGITTAPLDATPPASRFVLMLLMLAGGVPGGAGGGMFCTTLGVWLAAARRRVDPGRELPGVDHPRARVDEALRLAARIGAVFLGWVALGVFLLLLFEPYPMTKVLWEVTAAAGGCGFPSDITYLLTRFSKMVVLVVMVAGRIGPVWVLAQGLVGAGGTEGGGAPRRDSR